MKKYEVGYIFEESELPNVSAYLNTNDLLMSTEYDVIEKDNKKIKRYQLIEIPIELLEIRVRNKRNIYLNIYVDTLSSNPLRWNDFSEKEKEQLANYRKYLLNYPQQENWYKHYPLNFDEWKKV